MAEPGKEITRATLRRSLVVNALTKPLNVAVPAAVVVAAIVIGAWWLWAVAAITYLVLATMTFFDEGEAKRVGDRAYGRRELESGRRRVDPSKLARPIAAQLAAALQEEHRIRQAIDSSSLPLTDLGGEVSALIGELERTAGRAQLVYDYLAGQDPERVQARLAQLQQMAGPTPDETTRATIDALGEQLTAQREMQAQLNRYYAEMEQTVAALSTIHAQVVRMGVTTDAAGEEELTGRVRELRSKVGTLTEGISEAYADAPDTPG